METGSSKPMPEQDISGKRQTAPRQLLIRSQIEIAAVLRALAHDEVPLAAYLEDGELLFVTRVRHVDAETRRIVFDYGPSKRANAALLSSRTITLHCERGRMHLQFLASEPTETIFDGDPAVQFDLPEVMVQYDRRLHRRVRIPPHVPLRCFVDCPGVKPFEARVADIGRGGVGTILHDPAIRLEPGRVLTDCRILHPSCLLVRADVQISYSINTRLPDGTPVTRSGCRFIATPDELAELMRTFVVELEEDEQR